MAATGYTLADIEQRVVDDAARAATDAPGSESDPVDDVAEAEDLEPVA